MLKKMIIRKRSKLTPVRPRRVRRHPKVRIRICQPPLNYLMEEHPELQNGER